MRARISREFSRIWPFPAYIFFVGGNSAFKPTRSSTKYNIINADAHDGRRMPRRGGSAKVFGGIMSQHLRMFAVGVLGLIGGGLIAQATNSPPKGPQLDLQPVVDQAMAIYIPYMARQGVELRFVKGQQNMIFAYGNRDDQSLATVMVDVGYYQNPKITADGFRYMLCHELGHVTASAPHRIAPGEYDGLTDANGDLWISAEGQADYFAATKCMRELLVAEDNVAYMKMYGAPPTVVEKCDRSYANAQDSALCQRIMMAGKNFIDSFARSFPNSFEEKDLAEPRVSLLGEHPNAQCRLDTVVAGALCPIRKEESLDPYDPTVGSCTSRNFPEGARPRCWYKE